MYSSFYKLRASTVDSTWLSFVNLTRKNPNFKIAAQKTPISPQLSLEKLHPIFTPQILENIKPENEQPYSYTIDII